MRTSASTGTAGRLERGTTPPRGRAGGHAGADLRERRRERGRGDMVEMYAPLDEPLTEGETSGGTGAPAGARRVAGGVMAPGYTDKQAERLTVAAGAAGRMGNATSS